MCISTSYVIVIVILDVIYRNMGLEMLCSKYLWGFRVGLGSMLRARTVNITLETEVLITCLF